jgi:bifunctional UDP-N-acetylglucosamine pyrophosphorylase/glucosamine-1-phosphate N-acetyltransferase
MSHLAIVLAAGKGTRMKSTLPKVLHPIAGRPMLDWVLDAVQGTAPDRTMVVVGHGADDVIEGLPSGVEWCIQEEQHGTGHAAQVGLRALGDIDPASDVLVVPGDTPMLDTETLQTLVDRHREEAASVTLTSTFLDDPTGYGRIVRESDETVRHVVEERDANQVTRRINEVNAGMYVFNAGFFARDLDALETDNAQGEYYLTDVVGLAVDAGRKVGAVPADSRTIAGANDHAQLADAAAHHRRRIANEWMMAGVRMIDPERVYIDHDVELAAGVTLYPGVVLEAGTKVASGAVVGPDVYASGSEIGAGSRVWYAVLRDSVVGPECNVGPYASLRPGSVMEAGAKAGTFVETKNTTVGEGAKVPHLAYMGDATIGPGANIGAGTITCNYDGFAKYPTVIGSDVFIGSDTMLVAPVTIGDGAMTAAGSVITQDVEPGAMGVARSKQRNILGFVQRFAARYRSDHSEDEAR